MLRLFFPYLLFAAIVLFVALDHVSPRDEVVTHSSGAALVATQGPSTGRDLVCGMDVGDDITAVHEGTRYHFCHEMCREAFLDDPATYVRENCPVCLADDGTRTEVASDAPEFTWQGQSWRFCSLEHRDAFGADPAGYFVHSMWGIPPWLYAISVALVLILSFGLFEIVARAGRGRPELRPRLALFRVPGLKALVRWPHFRTLCQLLVVGVFALIVTAGLYGDQLASRNIAPLLTWTVWWGGLVLLIMFAGKAWCYVCPWDAIAGWVERLVFWRKRKGLGLGLAWPRGLRNIWLATAFFVGLTWLELGFGVTMNPRATALHRAWAWSAWRSSARWSSSAEPSAATPAWSGASRACTPCSPASEVRPADREVCRGCATKDCYHGNEHGDACPTGAVPRRAVGEHLLHQLPGVREDLSDGQHGRVRAALGRRPRRRAGTRARTRPTWRC